MQNACKKLLTAAMVLALMLALSVFGAAALADSADSDAEGAAPSTPGMASSPLTLQDFGIEEDGAAAAPSYLHPQTLVVDVDNENNSHSGYPDYDLNAYLFSNSSKYPIDVRFDVTTLPARSAYLAIYSYDCDEQGGYDYAERDFVYLNGEKIGVLTGENGMWNTTLIEVPISKLKKGANYIDVRIFTLNKRSNTLYEEYRWATEIKWAQLIIDGGASASRPEVFDVELVDAYQDGTDIVCDAKVTISSSVNRSYEVEYSLVDYSSEKSSTYMQIISADTQTVSGTSAEVTGSLSLPVNALSGEYSVQVLLRERYSDDILAVDEEYFDFTTSQLPSFDVTGLTATLNTEEYTDKNLTMSLSANIDENAGLSGLNFYVNNTRVAARVNGSTVTGTYTVTRNGSYMVELRYVKNGTSYNSKIYRVIDNLARMSANINSSNGLEIGWEGGILRSITVTSDHEWTVSSNAAWLTFDKTRGASGEKFFASVARNSSTTPRTANITIKSAGCTNIVIAVNQSGVDNQITGIKLTPASLKIAKKSKYTIVAAISPAGVGASAVEWSSSDTSVATVDANGKVTGVGVGTATITCAAVDGSGVSASVQVKVAKVKKAVTRIKLNKTEATISIKSGESLGKTYQLKATVSPSKASVKTLKWSSSDNSVARVDQNGLVTSVGYGSCKITAKAIDGSKEKVTCKITVSQKKVKSIEIKGKKNMKVGAQQQLTADISPAKAYNKDVKWKSSNPSVASVDENGVVTAHKKGKVTITCKALDGSKKKDTITIKVK